MMQVHLEVSVTGADAADVAQWIGEALANRDVRDSDKDYVVHSISVEQDS
jgi:hypothetical protein